MLSFLWIGTTLLFFQPSGYTPSSKKVKNENLWRFRNSFSAKLNHPNWHVVPSMGIFRIKIFWYKGNIFFFSVFTDANRPFVLYSNGGSTLLFLIGVHWEAKCELKSSAFFLKLEIIIPFTFRGWILGIFFSSEMYLELTNLPLASWKDYLISHLIFLRTILWSQQSYLSTRLI